MLHLLRIYFYLHLIYIKISGWLHLLHDWFWYLVFFDISLYYLQIFWYILIPLSKLWRRKGQPSHGVGSLKWNGEYILIHRGWCPSGMGGRPLYGRISKTGLKWGRLPLRSTTIKTQKKQVDFTNLAVIFKNLMSKTRAISRYSGKKTMKIFKILIGIEAKYSRMGQLLKQTISLQIF